MRIMSQYLIRLLLGGCLAFAGGRAAEAAAVRAVATTSLIADVARAVGGADVEVTALIPPDTDPHAFDPTPRDLARLHGADLVLANGLGLETFLDKVLEAGASSRQSIVIVSEGRTPRGCGAEEHHAHDHGEHDPHVWFDPTWVQQWADNIAAAFATRDPERAGDYRRRADAYKAELDQLDAWIRAEFSSIPAERRVVVTDHDEFGYLADRYALTVVGALLPTVTTVAEASARSLADLQARMREAGARVLVVGHSASPALAEQVARDVGGRVIRLRTHTLGAPGGETATYIGFMRENVRALAEALREGGP